MDEIGDLIKTIEELRERLEKLFESRGAVDQEVMAASQILDAVVNEYYRILKHKAEEKGG
ncbi:Spo0E like sporulation regulatory protein [Thermodesulfitimonas autotrophica]|uniref:Spo0E like sporulation regulatory protein n=1 Tax=Thermodesulfitimonas autotrophica TaxID=1894989 RepID=A0A3N5BBD1_9THEO|nr:aspartyl-phosphate phosphatase Spo0E family protein [Thermodesulfitimonas autotrophica]RPF43005.1 Spo0E like sporulation regulatory protein [Thermodesulfitimonas autotrophica]